MSADRSSRSSATSSRSEVAVAIPLYRLPLTADERISLCHARHYLSDFDCYFFLPKDLENPEPDFGEVRFAPRFFRSVRDYSRLLLAPQFYRRFSSYRFLLVYQLDCLVFSRDLAAWCERAYDYIGAPWLEDPARHENGFSRVGNGGLSLRRVDAHLGVLEAGVPSLSAALGRLLRTPALSNRRHGLLGRFSESFRVLRELRRGSHWYASHYSLNEDRFWSDRAALFSPSFRVATVPEALAFSFEQAPKLAFELTGGRLPFGCHGWARYGREFWQPHLLAGA